MAHKGQAEFIEIINVHTQKSKRMLKQIFLNMPIGKDKTRNGWVEKDSKQVSDLARLIPPELQGTGKTATVFKLASDIEDQVRAKVEGDVKQEMETLREDNQNLRKVNETLNGQIKELRENKGQGDGEVEKLATFLMKNHPDEVREGSAVDSAITLIIKQASQISAPPSGSGATDTTEGDAKNKKSNSKNNS